MRSMFFYRGGGVTWCTGNPNPHLILVAEKFVLPSLHRTFLWCQSTVADPELNMDPKHGNGINTNHQVRTKMKTVFVEPGVKIFKALSRRQGVFGHLPTSTFWMRNKSFWNNVSIKLLTICGMTLSTFFLPLFWLLQPLGKLWRLVRDFLKNN